ncbi:MAG: type II restriction endonuclease, partial [Chloroflexi bacterium]|nr:type II restriction endonuclease [Chloroflexota bacterium]
LRTYLRDNTRLKTVIDFGDLPIFEATTYPCVLVTSNRRPGDGEAAAQALNVRSMATLEYLADAVQRDGWPQPQWSLHPAGWALERPEVLALLEKLRRSGTPLGEYVGGKFYRGIVTGLNEAFVIDQVTRDRLVTEDPRSAEIIKPWLQGRDIKRWRVNWPKLYLLYVGWDCKIKRYPAALAHLKRFKKTLAKRPEVKDGRFPWYALSRYAAEYYQEFDKPKIVWPNLCIEPRFALDLDKCYVSAPANILPIAPDELFLVGILNSSAVSWFMKQIAAERAGGFIEYKPIYVTQIPVPDTTPVQRAAIEALVCKLLDAKGQGPQVAEWERELNGLVYEVYGLAEGEVGVVEGLEHE